ncbi:MAG: ribosome maturation factor RimP [Actinobacteria bacterium]|nr:MAG: ribosome maturation factor RimP [Actinomycetota bacterium]
MDQSAVRHQGGSDRQARLERLIAPVVADTGFDVEEIVLRPAGRRTQLIVAVDGDEVTSDGLAALSGRISEVLDGADAMGEQPYTLEVSSRGVSRPLTLPRHWRRNVGRLVKVELVDGSEVVGRIESADDAGVMVAGRSLDLADVRRAVVQVEFGAES